MAAVLLSLASYVALALTIWDDSGQWRAAYFLPWNRFFELMIGCVVGLIVASGRRVRGPFASRWFGSLAAAAAVGVSLVASSVGQVPHLFWEMPAISIVTAGLLLHLEFTTRGLRRFLGTGPLGWLGRRSYGIYLCTSPCSTFCVHTCMPDTRC